MIFQLRITLHVFTFDGEKRPFHSDAAIAGRGWLWAVTIIFVEYHNICGVVDHWVLLIRIVTDLAVLQSNNVIEGDMYVFPQDLWVTILKYTDSLVKVKGFSEKLEVSSIKNDQLQSKYDELIKKRMVNSVYTWELKLSSLPCSFLSVALTW